MSAARILAPDPQPELALDGEHGLPRWAAALDMGARLPFDAAVERGVLANGCAYYLRANGEPKDVGDLARGARGLARRGRRRARDRAHDRAPRVPRAERRRRGLLRDRARAREPRRALRLAPERVHLARGDGVLAPRAARVRARATELLARMVLDARISDADVEAEREIVLDAWRQSKGWAERARHARFRALFAGSRLAERLPIGEVGASARARALVRGRGRRSSGPLPPPARPRPLVKVDVIRGADPAVLRAFHARHYRPEHMCAVAVGDFGDDLAAARAMLEDAVGALAGRARAGAGGGAAPAAPAPAPRAAAEVPPHAALRVSRIVDPEATSCSATVVCKGAHARVGTVGDFARALVEDVFPHGALEPPREARVGADAAVAARELGADRAIGYAPGGAGGVVARALGDGARRPARERDRRAVDRAAARRRARLRRGRGRARQGGRARAAADALPRARAGAVRGARRRAQGALPARRAVPRQPPRSRSR